MPPNNPGSPPIRVLTASGRVLSLKKLNSMPVQSKLKKQKVSGYELEWEDLKDYLVKRFPNLPIEQLVEDKSEDWYHLELPEELTEKDLAEISMRKISRKAQAQATPRAVTPDGDETSS